MAHSPLVESTAADIASKVERGFDFTAKAVTVGQAMQAMWKAGRWLTPVVRAAFL